MLILSRVKVLHVKCELKLTLKVEKKLQSQTT